MRRFVSKLFAATLSVALALPGWAQAPAVQPAPASAEAPTYSKEQLDQLLAPIALYPDSLLTQVLMASTYPADVDLAVKWSAAHPNDKGDAAVTKVEKEPWEASVQSLVAFPQVLATMGQKPDWVQDLGDAFLAQPEDVMDAVQRLRTLAHDAGQLKTTEQQRVTVQASQASQPPIIIIEPAQPQVVFVPTYNPTVVYGAWPYPAFPPMYIPPPPGYYFGNALLAGMAFGAGLAITNAMWGGCNWGWGHSNVNINVNRYNNINVNKLNVNQSNFNHNSAARKGVPYGDSKVNQKYGKNVAGGNARNDYRGRDGAGGPGGAKDAQRDAARNTMAQRTNDPATREKLQQQASQRPGGADRETRPGNAGGANRDARPGNAGGGQDRMAASHRDQAGGAAGRPAAHNRPDNALSGAGNGAAARPQIDRGQASRSAAARPATRPQPSAAKSMSRPQGGGAGAMSRGGGGGGGRAHGGGGGHRGR